MNACSYDTVSHFPGWSVVRNWLFCLKFESSLGRKDPVMTIRKDHIWCQMPFRAFSDTCGSLGDTPAAMNACPYETASNCPGWSVVRNWLFCLKFESSLGRKDTAFTMRGSNMVSKSFHIILIHIREVREHSSSNECMSLWHSVTFPRLMWCPNLVILSKIWDSLW